MKREVIKRLKAQNGHFTQKDMILYLVDRVDNICDKLDKGTGKINDNRVDIAEIKASHKTAKTIITVAVSILGVIVTYLGATR